MHWYGSAQLTVDENGAMLNEQAGAMIQLAKDNDIPEVWITEMGSGYDVATATQDVSRTLCTYPKIYISDLRRWHLWFPVPIHPMAWGYLHEKLFKRHDHTLCL